MHSSVAYTAYSQNNVSIESPEKLIQMLYEGILRFTSFAKRAIKDGNIEKKTYWINRSTAIFSELITVLNYDNGGETAYYLRGLYTHQIWLLGQAALLNETQKLDEVLHVTKELLQAWKEETHDTAMDE